MSPNSVHSAHTFEPIYILSAVVGDRAIRFYIVIAWDEMGELNVPNQQLAIRHQAHSKRDWETFYCRFKSLLFGAITDDARQLIHVELENPIIDVPLTLTFLYCHQVMRHEQLNKLATIFSV